MTFLLQGNRITDFYLEFGFEEIYGIRIPYVNESQWHTDVANIFMAVDVAFY